MNNSTVFNVDNLKTGDIILFSGTCIVSRIIRFVCRNKWSHIGMVIVDPAYNVPLIYESSHGTNLIGLDLKRKTAGVQLLFLRDRIRDFKGDMVVRRLVDHNITPEDRSKLLALRKQLVGVPFEKNVWQMAASEFKNRAIPYREDMSSVFCSELIARCYQVLGLLGQDLPSNRYSPADFSAKRGLVLLSGKLGPEIRLKHYRK